jgi:hypothetical protein
MHKQKLMTGVLLLSVGFWGCGGVSSTGGDVTGDDAYVSEPAPCAEVSADESADRVVVWAEADLPCQTTLVGEEITVDNDGETQILEDSTETTGLSLKSAAKTLKLTHVATIAAPVYKGESLGATEVAIKGDYAYVTYNTRGDPFIGGIQVIQLTNKTRPQLVAQFVFTDTDVHTATVDGSNLYLGESVNVDKAAFASFEHPGSFEHVRLTGSDHYESTDGPQDLPSYAGTDIEVDGSLLYITVGAAGGGLVIYDLDSGTETAFIPIEDARSVALADSNTAIVFSGTNGKITVVNTDTYTSTSFETGGATIADSKSTVELLEHLAFIGGGDSGMIVADWDAGDVLTSVANPTVSGLSADLTVANAVTLYKSQYAFISNGEAGIRVANISSFVNDHNHSISVVGTLQFGTHESANAILATNSYLFVAAGTGGFRIVAID